MDEANPSGAPPAPRITDPPPGGHVSPDSVAVVTVTTNAPGLPLELVLLSSEKPGAELARTEIGADADSPSSHPIAIPPDPRPNHPTEYYLAVGVRDGFASEQYRHVVPVTTRPPG